MHHRSICAATFFWVFFERIPETATRGCVGLRETKPGQRPGPFRRIWNCSSLPECLDDYLSFTLFGPRVRICTACESRCAHLLRLAVSSLINQGVGQILSRFRLEPHETLVRLLAHPRVMGLCQHAVQHPREGLIARVALPPIVP